MGICHWTELENYLEVWANDNSKNGYYSYQNWPQALKWAQNKYR